MPEECRLCGAEVTDSGMAEEERLAAKGLCPNCGDEIAAGAYTVDLLASGYEWTCPNCGDGNTEIGVATEPECGGCGVRFVLGEAQHVYQLPNGRG